MADAKTAILGRILVTRLPGTPQRGRLLAGGARIACALGAHGVMRRKREGDGATPAGRFGLMRALYRADRVARPKTALPLKALRPIDGWCDDPSSGRYDCQVNLPFGAGHERLWRNDRLYDVVVVLDHNRRPCVRGRGSAIFLHIARPDLAPTAGCVAISPVDMHRLLPRLGPRAAMVIR